MNTLVTLTRLAPAHVLAAFFLLLPPPVFSQKPLATPVEAAQERLRRLADKPADIPVAVKEIVQLLNAQERQFIRAFLAQEVLSMTNFETRLALLDAVVDATTWTNTNERCLADDNLTVSLRQAFQHDARRAIRDRAEIALLRRNNATAADGAWVAGLVRSGRWDALPLAIRWRERTLSPYVREMLSSASSNWPSNQTIRIVPSVYVGQEKIEASDLTPLQKMQLRNLALSQSVYLGDLLVAYLASIGDEEALASLKTSYQMAAPPREDRKPAHKDKLYWYCLLCLAGDLPGPLPAP